MPIPTTLTFDLFDWSPDASTFIEHVAEGLIANASLTRGAPWIQNDAAPADRVLIVSDDGIPSRITVPLSVPSVHTLEFTLELGSLPDTFEENQFRHVFLGALNAQGKAAGLLVSQAGLAVVGAPGTPGISPLSGTPGLIVTEALTVRVVVDGSLGLARLYVTLASQVGVTGHILRHTVVAPTSSPLYGDAFVVQLLGDAFRSTDIALSALRLASTLVEPAKPPTAVAGADQAVGIGMLVQLDGTDSTDPEGATLTYSWTIIRQPVGSDITLSGMARATDVLGSVRFTSALSGAGGNGQAITVTLPALNPASVLTLAVDAFGVIQITLRNSVVGPGGITDAEELVSALSDPNDPAYSAAVSALISGTVIGLPDDVVPAGSATLAAGADSTLARPIFYPDVLGLYEFTLVVNDGGLDSPPSTTLVNVLQTEVRSGHVPDPTFVWSHLSDFWKLHQDKERFTKLWSSIIQLVGAELLRLWHADYAKSLRDIPRLSTERWQGFETRWETTGTLQNYAGFASVQREIACTPLDDGDGDLTTTTVLLSAAAFPYLVAGQSAVIRKATDTILATVIRHDPFRTSGVDGVLTLGSDLFTSALVNFNGFGIRPNDTLFVVDGATTYRLRVKKVVSATTLQLVLPATATVNPATFQVGGALTFAEDVVDVYLQVDSGTLNGSAVDDGDVDDLTPDFAITFGTFSVDVLAGTDQLLIDWTPPPGFPPAPPPPVIAAVPTSTTLTMATEIYNGVAFVSWQIIRYVGNLPLTVTALPYLVCDTEPGTEVTVGDPVVLRNAETGELRTTYVVAVSADRVAVDVPTGDALLDEGTWQVDAFVRCDRIPISEDIRGIPQLQAHSGAAEIVRQTGLDYVVDEAAIVFERKSGTCSTVADSDLLTSLDTDLTGTEGYVISLPWWDQIFDPGPRKIVEVLSATVVRVDVPYTVTGVGFPYTVLRHGAQTFPPLRWWAEYTYADNWQVIENNFGLLVGLKKEDLDGLDVDYLSSVRALHFALWSGPHLANVRIGAQVFFGLPFAEVTGTIVELYSGYSATHGRLVVADAEDSAVLRAYYWPLSVGLATNPDTGSAYTDGDTVLAFSPLSDGAVVEDWLTDPDWFDGILVGAHELEKFHTFSVEVDLTAVTSANGFHLLRQFVDRVKPKYTKVVLIGRQDLPDEIDLTDAVTFSGTLYLEDELYTLAENLVEEGTAQSGGPTTIQLATTASPVNSVYDGFTVRLDDGTGKNQVRTITSYVGATRTATVAAWDTEPDLTSVYSVFLPPPFSAGFSSRLDFYDGQGNWYRDSDVLVPHPTRPGFLLGTAGQLKMPFGGAAPTAIVDYEALVGPLMAGMTVRSAATSSFVGTVSAVFPTDAVSGTVWIAVTGGSIPPALMSLSIGAATTADVVSSSLGAWPEFSAIDRNRSEIWLPLDPETILGRVQYTGALAASTPGPGQTVTLDGGASAEDETYINWWIEITTPGSPIEGERVRISGYVGATKVATLFDDFSVDPLGTESFRLYPPKPIARLEGLDFFEPGDVIEGQTSGHRAVVGYFGPSYLRVISADRSPYDAFLPGEVVVGPNGEQGQILNDVLYVFPDMISRADRGPEVGPSAHLDYRVCWRAGADGKDPTFDMGLKFDDVELFQKPFDPAVPILDQMVPSQGPGMYWWFDKKLVYNHVDLAPIGPGPEPLWVPSPSVNIGVLAADPTFNDNVIRNRAICRAVAPLPGSLPSPAGNPIPDAALDALI